MESTVENSEIATTSTAAVNAEAAVAPAPNNEFSYLDRNEFTSEIYKIEVRNLGYFGAGEFKKLIKSKLNLDMSKIKLPGRKDFAFVCLRSKEDQERAIELLNGYKWKGRVLQAYAAKASADPLMKHRNQQQQNDENSNGCTPAKKQRTSAEATCPLAALPYEDQLKQKKTDMENVLQKFKKDLIRTNGAARKHLDSFKFEGVLPSPEINGYRNKNEFTVGKNAEGEIIVGFRLGSYADGSVEVSAVESLPHLPDAAKWAARSFQEFVRNSKLLPFNPEGNAGHIRQLMVRTSTHTGEIMLVPGIFSTNFNADELNQFKKDIVAFYEEHNNAAQFNCTSLYYQDVKHREAGQMVSPVTHLYGTEYISDHILELKFRISPLAFFQNNTNGANVLYQQAIDLAKPKPHSTVLDICCGTGTIALCFAKHCKQVLGVEIIPEAIKDAQANAEVNKITNCKFYAGNADDYIQSLVREAVYDNPTDGTLDLLAIVDPPRAGLHNRSIVAIRAASAIQRLVYIACNPMRAQRNWIELGRPESKQYKGRPFYPKTAVAVDMFPHTTHTELIILFEREPVQETKKSEVAKVVEAKVDTPTDKVADEPKAVVVECETNEIDQIEKVEVATE